jgi:hypothetical protein
MYLLSVALVPASGMACQLLPVTCPVHVDILAGLNILKELKLKELFAEQASVASAHRQG